MVPAADDFKTFDTLDWMMLLTLVVIFIGFPASILFGEASGPDRFTFWSFLFVSLNVYFFVWMFSFVVGSNADVILTSFRLLGVLAIAVIFSQALNKARTELQFWVILACTVLVVLGSWSIISGIVMSQQAARLTEGKHYTISLHKQNVTLPEPNWWRLRGASFTGPNSRGISHPYFDFHATLATEPSDPVYNWSKRHMRFDLVR